MIDEKNKSQDLDSVIKKAEDLKELQTAKTSAGFIHVLKGK